MGGGGVLIQCIATVLRPLTLASLLIDARMEHVGFSPTRHTSRAPSAKRREVFGESREWCAAFSLEGGGVERGDYENQVKKKILKKNFMFSIRTEIKKLRFLFSSMIIGLSFYERGSVLSFFCVPPWAPYHYLSLPGPEPPIGVS